MAGERWTFESGAGAGADHCWVCWVRRVGVGLGMVCNS